MNASKILTDAIGVLEQRGRSYGTYLNQQGEVCVLGALALAAGTEHDIWEGLGLYPEDEWELGDAEMVEAARQLLTLLPVKADLNDLPIQDLIEHIGDWHDGVSDADGDKPRPPANSVVFAKLAEAARLAEKAGAANV
ncbi:hypothetical protein ETD86_37115 [Nonomuraea turkmeniaca]|uniref:Uncharacterized protein n=1 Tax=Nonomuraea turkmeniaca TaxID=103838 RepID=A0A5S4F4T0_9ACTN|nr:hypothetical protein [Nonomuraea turkmeniaca]TMR11067.1 hypothetical protein ETD86_37115 [Nonomuraea turkmeniaca]